MVSRVSDLHGHRRGGGHELRLSSSSSVYAMMYGSTNKVLGWRRKEKAATLKDFPFYRFESHPIKSTFRQIDDDNDTDIHPRIYPQCPKNSNSHPQLTWVQLEVINPKLQIYIPI